MFCLKKIDSSSEEEYLYVLSHDFFRFFAQRIDFSILSSHFEFQEKFIDFSVLIYLDWFFCWDGRDGKGDKEAIDGRTGVSRIHSPSTSIRYTSTFTPSLGNSSLLPHPHSHLHHSHSSSLSSSLVLTIILTIILFILTPSHHEHRKADEEARIEYL